ncbi:MAG: DEAD/DEAH box helicase family protein [Comamonadaceae bacterium]|nr:DEAD/DEAH box helicase family protein [Comamonadaceae bacterium]
MTLITPITAPQSASFSPKQFQARIIHGVCGALAENPRPPCLLRSPTGSGKTFMLTKILENVSKTSESAVAVVCAVCQSGGANRGHA